MRLNIHEMKQAAQLDWHSCIKYLLSRHTVNEGHIIVKVQGSWTSTASPDNNIILRVLYGLCLHFFSLANNTYVLISKWGYFYIQLNSGIVN